MNKKIQPVSTPLPVAASDVAPTVPPKGVVQTEAQKMWDEIKNLPIDMFGLPDRVISQHCFFANVEPSKLYLTTTASSALPALETALQGHFTVEAADKFIVVSRAPKPLSIKK